ncbi:MAG TPA: hypothetical protein VEC57_10810 [Candidatus Limnocylindrales bacterium]|nr:hypothetical protein [Candidatus Limnocylindrales bacterium]
MGTFVRASSLVAAMVLTAGVSTAGAVHDGRCDSDKFRAAARSAQKRVICYARARGTGSDLSDQCTDKATAILQRGFSIAQEIGACSVDGDDTGLQNLAAAFAADADALFASSPAPNRCAADKLRRISRAVADHLACHAAAAAEQVAVDEACVEAAAQKLVDDFQNIAVRRTCAGEAGDAQSLIESLSADSAAEILGAIAGSPPTGLVGTVDGGIIELSWTHPDPDNGLSHAKVLRRLNAAPDGPDDGQATEVFFGVGEQAADDLTLLLPDTAETPRTYHYAVYACTSAEQCEVNGSHDAVTPTIVQALRAGGYVIHWRHASADVCSDRTDLGKADSTSVPNWWRTCDSNCATTTARQLNDTGRAEAVAIGDAFATRGIPVGRVISSEFCRNFETAALMDFGPVVEETPLITYFVYDEGNRCAHSYDLLAQTPAAGTNTALIGHAGFSCPVLAALAWSEAAIFKPDGAGSSTFIARVLDDGWLGLP